MRLGIRAELDLQEVIAGDPLVRPPFERGNVTSVAFADQVAEVLAGIVPGAGNRLRHPGEYRIQRGRVAREALVDEDLRVRRVVDDQQRRVVDEVGLPELGGDAQVVLAVAWGELIAANQHAVLGLRHPGGVLRVDAHPERRPPEHIGDEAQAGTVVGEEPRAGSLEALLGNEHAARRQVEVGLHHAVRPRHARHVDLRLLAQAEVDRGAGQDLLLHEEARARLDFAADPERVDPLIARRDVSPRADLLPPVAGAAPPEQPDRGTVLHPDQVEPAVGVQIGDGEELGRDRCIERAVQQYPTLVGQPDP